MFGRMHRAARRREYDRRLSLFGYWGSPGNFRRGLDRTRNVTRDNITTTSSQFTPGRSLSAVPFRVRPQSLSLQPHCASEIIPRRTFGHHSSIKGFCSIA